MKKDVDVACGFVGPTDSFKKNLICYPSFRAYMDHIIDKHEVTDLSDVD